MKDEFRPANVIVVIVTDGEENASKKHTLEEVRDMIQHQQDVYGWKFIFLGADTADWMGRALGTYSTTTYSDDAHGTHEVYAASSSYLRSVRSGDEQKMDERI